MRNTQNLNLTRGTKSSLGESTLVSVHGYAGDAEQVRNLLPFYLHHGCRVVIVSPVDSPIGPKSLGNPRGVDYRYAGLRAYTGDASLERQKLHMKLLLEFDADWFLMNDSDSFVISPRLPKYFFHPNVFWSHEASDLMHVRPPDWPYWRLAFQPPYFCSKRTLVRMVGATARVRYEDIDMKFIDHYLMRLAFAGGVEHHTFHNGCSCETLSDIGRAHMKDCIRRGGVTLHAVKTPEVIRMMAEEYARVTKK